MVVAHGDCIAAMHRCVHEKFADVRQHIFRLCKVDELALTSTLPVVQGTQTANAAPAPLAASM